MSEINTPPSEKETVPNQDRENAKEATKEVLESEATKAVTEANSNDYLQQALESNESEATAEPAPDLGLDASL